jgi:CheY-like chemotaxis protein
MLHILVVEDNKLNQSLLCRYMEVIIAEAKGATTFVTADNGQPTTTITTTCRPSS